MQLVTTISVSLASSAIAGDVNNGPVQARKSIAKTDNLRPLLKVEIIFISRVPYGKKIQQHSQVKRLNKPNLYKILIDNDKVAYGKMQGISPAIHILAPGNGI